MAQAPYCLPLRFGTQAVFSPFQLSVQTGVPYGQALNWQDSLVDLRFDIAYPSAAHDSLAQRPLVLLFTGGGFLAADRSEMNPYGLYLAQRGFVAASLDYRTGWDAGLDAFDPSAGCNGDSTGFKLAIYRALQDAKAALRHLVANASLYGIDTATIIVGGVSAGGVIALNMLYADQAEFDAFDPHLSDSLGSLDSSGGNLSYAGTRPKICVSIAGAVLDTHWLQAAEAVPTLLFHGLLDSIVPYAYGPPWYCTSPVRYAEVAGSRPIYDKLRQGNGCVQLHGDSTAGHAPYDLNYLLGTITCFIKSAFCGNCSTFFTHDTTLNCPTAPITSLAHQQKPSTQVLFLLEGMQVGQTVFEGNGTELRACDALGRPMLVRRVGKGEAVVEVPRSGLYLLSDGQSTQKVLLR